MDKLSLCRICLVENVRMYVVVSRQLQETFKKLTNIPFLTEDRPTLACFFCYAKLKQCSQFQRKCMEAEIAFKQIIKADYEPKPVSFQYFSGFVKTPVNHLDIAEHQTEDGGVNQEFNFKQDTLEQDHFTEQESPEDIFIKQEDLNNHNTLGHCYQNLDGNIKLEIEDGNYQQVSIELQETPENTCYKLVEDLSNHSVADTDNNVTSTKRYTVVEIVPNTKTEVDKLKGMSEAEKQCIEKTGDMNSAEQKTGSETIDACITTKPDIKIKNGVLTTANLNDSIKVKNTMDSSESTVVNTNIRNDISDCIKKKTHVKLHECDTCHRSFSARSNLLRHFRVHTGENPYKCEICKQRFRYSSSLVSHIRAHTGEKPYGCDTCQRRFVRKCDMLTHIRIHSGEKPYKCDTCQKSFRHTKSLNRHSRVHTGEKPYACDICQRSFAAKCDLLVHIRVHTGEKPYKCDTCQKCFSQKGSLFHHIKVHTRVKTFKCNVCSRNFRDKTHLLCHIAIKHRKKSCEIDNS